MTLNIIPATMRARHHETGEWHVLSLDAFDFGKMNRPWDDYFHEDFVDEPYYVNLIEYDRFEGVV
jgi:hypothetical protein